MRIIKSTGLTESYSPDKIREGLGRAGLPIALADRVVNAVTERVREGTTTKRISQLINDQLKRENRSALYRYTLRDALLRLGPAGFKFEKYVAAILEAYGYRTELPEELQGACVKHEVDIVARKDGRTVMIEAKFRNAFSHFVRLKDTMATWTRFNDLNDGAAMGLCPKFDEVWIVTNGKISSRSQKFGACKGVRMFGWHYPKERGLADLVDHTALYPITALHDLKAVELERLSERGIMLCRQIADHSPKRLAKRIGIGSGRAEKLITTCRQIIAPDRSGAESGPHEPFA